MHTYRYANTGYEYIYQRLPDGNWYYKMRALPRTPEATPVWSNWIRVYAEVIETPGVSLKIVSMVAEVTDVHP